MLASATVTVRTDNTHHRRLWQRVVKRGNVRSRLVQEFGRLEGHGHPYSVAYLVTGDPRTVDNLVTLPIVLNFTRN